MDEQRTEYIQATKYEPSDCRRSQRNGYYERDLTTRIGSPELKVPRTRDGEFSPTVFERYQRNDKSLLDVFLWRLYTQDLSNRRGTVR